MHVQPEDAIRVRQRVVGTRIPAVAMLLSLVACPSSSAAGTRFQAAGRVAGQSVETVVDSAAAAYYVNRYVNGDRTDAALDRMIDAAIQACHADPYDREAMACLGRRVSTDFATIDFVARLYDRPSNKRAQDEFREIVERLGASGPPDAVAPPEAFQSYFIAFVPGYAYKKDRTTGADFGAQRAILNAKGFRTVLVETDELGSVEGNAAIVADRLNRLAEREDRVIVVSASKGGPEVAHALSEGLSKDTVTRVKAWISVGGILRGSPYADRFLTWPRRWLAAIGLAFSGLPSSILSDLSTGVRRPAFDRLQLPPGILTLQYVGAPLSGQVSKSTRGRYKALRPQGPNDGLTLLSDELVEGGVVVTEIGLDHYFRDPAIDLKTLALTYVVLDQLERQEGGSSTATPGFPRSCLPPADDSHPSAASPSAVEPIAAVGLESRHGHSGRHLELLQDLSRPGIDSPQIAPITFPGGMPELCVDPCHPGDEAVGLDRA